VRFEKIVIQNYKTFRNRTQLDFNNGYTPGSNEHNVFLVGGMNGSGKTSILDAINLCLYGEKKLDKVFKSINQYELEKGNRCCFIELQFVMDNGDNICLNRSWDVPYIFSGIPSSEDLKEKISIKKNNRIISEFEQQSFLEYIKTEIPEGITQFFFFDGEKIQHIAADEYAAMDLKNSMEAALGIQNIHKLIDDLDHIKRDERKDIPGITNEDIHLQETEIDQLKNKKGKLEKQAGEIETQVEQYRGVLSESKTFFKKEFGFESNDILQKEQNEKTRLKLTSRLSELDMGMKTIIQTNFAFAQLIPFFDKVKSQIQNEKKLRVERSKQGIADTIPSEILNEIKSFEEVNRKQPLTEAELQFLQEKITAIIHKYIKIKGTSGNTPEILKLSDDDAKKIVIKMEDIENGVSDKFIQLLQEKQKVQADLDIIEKDLSKKNFEGSRLTRFNEIQTRLEVVANDIGERNEQLKQITIDLENLSKSIIDKEQKLEEAYTILERSTKKGAFLKQIANISQLLTEYVDQLRSAKINQLETSTFQMFKQLLSKGESVVQLSIDPKTYLIMIKNDSGLAIRKEALSAGEKEIFAISLLWGLAQTSQLKLPIIIDTPLSRLDSTHRDRIVSNYFPNAGHQVIILSTDTEVDKKYYTILENHLQDAIHLKYNPQEKRTTIEEGYFWRTA
jgi:DNA sulfur modification protein DndD